MNSLLSKYFSLNTLIVFLILFSIYSLSLTIELKFVFTDDFYLKALEERNNIDNIQNFIGTERDSQWKNYPITIFVIIIPSLLIGFCLNLGTAFNNYKISYSKLFGLAMKAQIVFAFNYFIAILLKAFNLVGFSYNTANNNFNYQSALIFFDPMTLPYWLKYPLQSVNITEIVHILFLSLGLSMLIKIKYLNSLFFVLLWYGIGLFFWIVFTVFLQTIFYN